MSSTKTPTSMRVLRRMRWVCGGCGGCLCMRVGGGADKLHRKGGIPDVSEVRQISNSSGQHPRGFAAILTEVRTIFVRCWGYYCKFVRYSDKSILYCVRTCAVANTDARGRGRCPAGMAGAGNWSTGSDVIDCIPGIPTSGNPIAGVSILARIHYNLPYMKY
jgi:hypothetical protein